MAERAKATPENGADGEPKKSRRKAQKAPKPGEAGHNSGEVPDEVYQRHLEKIDETAKALKKAKEVYDQVKGVHQSAYKAAKSDGCDIDAIKRARKLHELDHGVVVTEHANTGRVLRLMNSPLGTQFGLFDDIKLPPPVNAVLAGAHAGKNGEDRANNPHMPGSDEFEQWDSSWLSEQTKIAERMAGDGASAH